MCSFQRVAKWFQCVLSKLHKEVVRFKLFNLLELRSLWIDRKKSGVMADEAISKSIADASWYQPKKKGEIFRNN